MHGSQHSAFLRILGRMASAEGAEFTGLLLCHGGRSIVPVFSEESGDESTEHFSGMNRKVTKRLALELSTLCGTDRLLSGGDHSESGAAGRGCTTGLDAVDIGVQEVQGKPNTKIRRE